MKLGEYIRRQLYGLMLRGTRSVQQNAKQLLLIDDITKLQPISPIPVILLSYATTGIGEKDELLALSYKVKLITDNGIQDVPQEMGLHIGEIGRNAADTKINGTCMSEEVANTVAFHGITESMFPLFGIPRGQFKRFAQQLIQRVILRFTGTGFTLPPGVPEDQVYMIQCPVLTYNTEFLVHRAAHSGINIYEIPIDFTATIKKCLSRIALSRKRFTYTPELCRQLGSVGRLPLAKCCQIMGVDNNPTQGQLVCHYRIAQLQKLLAAVCAEQINLY